VFINALFTTIVVDFLGFSTSKARDTAHAPKDPALGADDVLLARIKAVRQFQKAK